MKILTVVAHLSIGGTARAAQNFSVGYTKLGHDVRVCAVSGFGPREIELVRFGIKPFNLDDILKGNDGWFPEVIHLHSHGLTKLDVVRLARRFPSAVVVETNVFSKPTEWSDNVVISCQLSKWCRDMYLSSSYDCKDIEVQIVPNPVDAEHFFKENATAVKAIKDDYGIPHNYNVVGKIGQPFDGKWSEALICAFESIGSKCNNTIFVVVGAPASFRANIVNRMPLDRLVLIDHLPSDVEVRRVLNCMDVFLHISEQGESFGYVLAEALLCETPVVVLNTPWADNSQSEVIGHGAGGFACSTVSQCISNVINILRSKQKASSLGARGRSHILRHYNTQSVCELMLKYVCATEDKSKSNCAYFTTVVRKIFLRLIRFNSFIRFLRYAYAGMPVKQRLMSKLCAK